MTTFLYSDPHYGHENIIKYCNRPFANAAEMDKELIKRYNSRVSDSDTVIWLGDCGFNKDKEKIRELLAKLRGKKILIRGNHDKNPGWMQSVGFDFVMESCTILIGKKYVNLCHFPYKLTTKEKIIHWFKGIKDRFNHRRFKDEGRWLIHGHVHNNMPKRTNKSINVCVDVWDYYPVPMKEIVKLMSQAKNKA